MGRSYQLKSKAPWAAFALALVAVAAMLILLFVLDTRSDDTDVLEEEAQAERDVFHDESR